MAGTLVLVLRLSVGWVDDDVVKNCVMSQINVTLASKTPFSAKTEN